MHAPQPGAVAASIRSRFGRDPHAIGRVSVHISRGATQALRRGEVWVFQEAVLRQRGDARPGDLAVLYDPKDKPLALGVMDPASPIRVRVLTTTLGQNIDADWMSATIHQAVRARDVLNQPSTTGYRLIHGLGDGLPGLVVDRYDHCCVLKVYSAAWLPWLPVLVDALVQATGTQAVLLRLSRQLQADPATRPWHEGAILWGEEAQLASSFLENGIHFEVDPRRGQKTGFFLDQRENRERVEKLSAKAKVLNVFCYTGGFSLYAARGGAREVVSIDASKLAMDAMERNIALNSPWNESACWRQITGDAFEEMARLQAAGERFDVVVVDPPSFAKRAAEVENAQRAYRRLAALAVGLLSAQGTLVYASCSSRITMDDLEGCLIDGAQTQRVRLEVLARVGHPIDHPVPSVTHQYLKCIYARIAGGDAS